MQQTKDEILSKGRSEHSRHSVPDTSPALGKENSQSAKTRFDWKKPSTLLAAVNTKRQSNIPKQRAESSASTLVQRASQLPVEDPIYAVVNGEPITSKHTELLARAKLLQQTNTFWQKCRWVAGDRKILIDHVAWLRTACIDLREIWQLRSPQAESDRRLWAMNDSVSELHARAEETQEALAEAHEAIKNNGVIPQDHRVSVQLALNFKEFKDDLKDAYHDLRGRSTVINLMHERQEHGNTSSHNLFHVEIDQSEQQDLKPIKGVGLQSLARARRPEYETADTDLELWGFIKGAPRRVRYDSEPISPGHALLADFQTEWQCCGDLAFALRQYDFCARLNTYQRVDLALTIAISHLYFLRIQDSCSNLSATDIKYYSGRGKTAENLLDAPELLILKPWAQINLGKKAQRKMRGERETASSANPDTFTRLAFLLYQVGSGRCLDNPSRTQLAFFKQEVRRQVEHGALDDVGGLAYSELVRLLLDIPERPFLSDAQKLADGMDILIGVSSKLLECQKRLESTLPQEESMRAHQETVNTTLGIKESSTRASRVSAVPAVTFSFSPAKEPSIDRNSQPNTPSQRPGIGVAV